MHYTIIGAGLFGATIAERIAAVHGMPVTVIDRRAHIGGNCWSELYPSTQVEYHMYGSHIFHTSHEHVWEYINKFTTFNTYQHKVYTTYKNKVYSMPINLDTINSYYNLNLKPYEVDDFLAKEKGNIPHPKNLEEKAISLIGRPLYEAFIKGYTQKQWEKAPTELSADIITRLPVRASYNNRYFAHKYEGIPLDGYGAMLSKMLENPLITVKLNTEFNDIRAQIPKDATVIYTGPIDAYFDYSLGRLEWRTVDFEYDIKPLQDYQGCSVMNFADIDIPYTRVHEFKHYHPERDPVDHTVISREYSRFAKHNDEPYYPVDTAANTQLFNQYKSLAESEQNVIFGGRLGMYKYMDMDATIHEALKVFETLF